MIKVERRFLDNPSVNTPLNDPKRRYGVELISGIAKEWLEADKRNFRQLRHVQEDRLCCCLQNLNVQDLIELKKCFSDVLGGQADT